VKSSIKISRALDDLREILRMKKVLVFDWDGTVLDSMPVKSVNFGRAFCAALNCSQDDLLANAVVKEYLALSGRPRKEIFLQIVNNLGLNAPHNSFKRFSDNFQRMNKARLTQARIFPDALELLEVLKNLAREVCISSSVPPQELSDLVGHILPKHIRCGITLVLGSNDDFSKGRGHIQAIVEKTRTPLEGLLMLGDDIADYELSLEAGVDCVLVNRSGISNQDVPWVVNSLNQIKEMLLQ
jgi:phosphoglycolate phosphatase-like HAD superfamily hydrolase